MSDEQQATQPSETQVGRSLLALFILGAMVREAMVRDAREAKRGPWRPPRAPEPCREVHIGNRCTHR